MFATRTFVFGDLVGSTRAWESDPTAMRERIATFERTTAEVAAFHGGEIFKRTGDGVCLNFSSALSALFAARDLQLRLQGSLLLRIGVYAGEAEFREGDWYGPPLNRCSRVMDSAHGGQIVVARSAYLLVESALPEGMGFIDLGSHVLRDVAEPMPLVQLTAPGLPTFFPPIRTLRARLVALPRSRTSLVGREDALEMLGSLLAANRFLTLAGAGGTGKTRLAIELARLHEAEFDLAVFVDLAKIEAGNLVIPEAAKSVGVPPEVPPDLDAVVHALAGRQALLIFDNAEHLLDEVADLVDALLDRTEQTRVIVTSREPLGLSGERIFRVRSLDPETVAPVLFCDRAGGGSPTATEVRELCRRLDGIPLAVEMAAARARSLGVREVLAHLDERLRALTGGRRANPRHATLQATLDWSYDLLADRDARTLRRLAVFAGDFPTAAVSSVCLEANDEALTILGSLADKSLVELDGDARRGRINETVRLYAAERLAAAGESAAIRDRHLKWVRSLLREGSFDTPELFPELDNLRAAIAWAEENGRPADVVELIAGSAGLWWAEALQREVAARLETALELAESELSISSRVAARVALSMFAANELGDNMRSWAEAALHIDPSMTCPSTMAAALLQSWVLGHLEPEEALARLAVLRPHLDQAGADVRVLSAFVEVFALAGLGQRRAAVKIAASCPRDRATLLVGVDSLAAMIELVEGRTVEAARLLALASRSPTRLRLLDAVLLDLDVSILAVQGDIERAKARLADLLLVGERYVSMRGSEAIGLTAGAWIALAERDTPAAAKLVEFGLRTFVVHRCEHWVVAAQHLARRLEVEYPEDWATANGEPLASVDEVRGLLRSLSSSGELKRATGL